MGTPLDGIRVIDLGQIYAAPYCTLQLAGMGAEVIKIEPPGRGESLRHHSPDASDVNYAFLMLNANKKSVALNLKDPRGRGLLLRMLERADALVENYGRGVMESLGLGYNDLRERFPRLIYSSAKGYGDGSRYAQLGAMDSTIQAACGYINATGFADGHGVKTPATFIDMGTGSHLASAIVAALFERERTGRGQKVEVAMFDVAMAGMTSLLSIALQKRPLKRVGNGHPGVCPSNIYPSADGGEVLIFCLTEKHWRALATLVGRTELLELPQYKDHSSRLRMVDEVDRIVADWTGTKRRDELIEVLTRHGVPAAPVRSVEEVIGDPELNERGLLVESNYPTRGAIRVLGMPLRFSGDDGTNRTPTPPPVLGADTDSVLGEIGISRNEIDKLRADGVIGPPPEIRCD